MNENRSHYSEEDNLFNFYTEIGTLLNCRTTSSNKIITGIKTSAGFWPNLIFFNGEKEDIDLSIFILSDIKSEIFICKRNFIGQEQISQLRQYGYYPFSFWQGMKLDLNNVQPPQQLIEFKNKKNTILELLNFTILKHTPIKESDFTKMAESPQIDFFSLNKNGQTLSTMTTYTDGQYAGLYFVVTDPNFRKQGYASILLSNVLYYLYLQDIKQVVLHATVEGISLYKNFGFEKTESIVLFRKCSF